MNIQLVDALNTALDRLRADEPLPAVLASYTAHAEQLTPLLRAATALETLRPVALPAPKALAADRADFLAKIPSPPAQTVSSAPLTRLKGWIAHHLRGQSPGTSQRKKEGQMIPLLVKATLIFTLIFGSAGGVAVLSADSLPGSPLYPAKLAVEQVRLTFTTDPTDRAALHLELAQVRVQELERIARGGDVPDQASLNRLQTHLNQGLKLAAGLPDEAMRGWLTQARQMAQNGEQRLLQAQAGATPAAQERLGQAALALNQLGQEAEAGLQDPLTFRWRHGGNRPPEAPPQPTPDPQPDQPGPGQHGGNPDAPCDEGDCEPDGDQHRYGPQPEQPGPGEPGGNPDTPCDEGDCEPDGDQHRYGPQPDQPGPGEPGGNPDAPCEDCEPAGDEHHYGPQPEQPGPGEPGGNPDAPCEDCEPAGDEHHYGPQPEQPGPGEPGGNPDAPCEDCEPAGDEHHYGPQPEQPDPGGPGSNPDPEPTPAPTPAPTPSPTPGHGDGPGDGGGHGGGHQP